MWHSFRHVFANTAQYLFAEYHRTALKKVFWFHALLIVLIFYIKNITFNAFKFCCKIIVFSLMKYMIDKLAFSPLLRLTSAPGCKDS